VINDSRYVAPAGANKQQHHHQQHKQQHGQQQGFQLTKENFKSSMEQMMQDIDVWKRFHDHIHEQAGIVHHGNKTESDEDKKVKPGNKEISMYQNTPTVRTTKATTTTTTPRLSVPADWNPPGNP
jgi:hypothetical protein